MLQYWYNILNVAYYMNTLAWRESECTFCIRSVPVPYPFHTCSISVLYLFCSVLFPFCQCPIGKCSWNSFRRMRFPRTHLQECFQGISNTRFKLSPYVCVHEYKKETYIYVVKLWVQLLEKYGKMIVMYRSNRSLTSPPPHTPGIWCLFLLFREGGNLINLVFLGAGIWSLLIGGREFDR